MLKPDIHFFSKKNIVPPDREPYSGFLMEENQRHDTHDSLFHCLVKSMIIFSASMGCINGLMTEFEIEYNYVIVGFYILISSLALSFMHMKRWIFNIGYPALFFLFASALIRYRTYANSGFQAFINILNESYSSHFLLNFTRESTELITDRYTTITIMAVFVGIFLAILINVGTFNDMFFLTVFDFTFWPLQLGIYIGQYPSYISMVFVFFAFFSACFLKLSGHYHFVYPEKQKKYFFTYKQKGASFVFHKSNARNMSHLCGFALAVALFFSFFGIMSVSGSEREALHPGVLKSSLDDSVKILVQTGLVGMFNRYDATGGISGGKLGGVSSVRPDYEPDLNVTFVPYAFERIYLKAYIGATYAGDQWLKPAEEIEYIYSNLDSHKTVFTESDTLTKLMQSGATPEMSGIMILKNLDASPNFAYLPYYTSAVPDNTRITAESTTESVFAKGSEMEIEYVPYSASLTDLDEIDKISYMILKDADENRLAMAYQTEAYNNYLSIPESIRQELESFHSEIGESENISEQISMVRNFLYSCYTYDMSPGGTPNGKDYVTYFLETQKRGYCAHFATAGTLLLRSYGIPARYVEGYVIDQSNISEGMANTDYTYEELFQGENPLENSQVVSVDISDGNAHAWVEVFINGFGWIPVEMTPPSDNADQVSYSEFLSALSGLLVPASSQNSAGQELPTERLNHRLLPSLRIGNSPVLTAFFVIIVLLLALPSAIRLYQFLAAYRRRRRDYQNGAYASSVSYGYQRLHKKMQKKYPHAAITLPEDVCLLLASRLSEDNVNSHKKEKALASFLKRNKTSVDSMISLTQKCAFGKTEISKDEADILIRFYLLASRIYKR